MVGADIEALRLLADKFDEGSDRLETIVTTVESAVPQDSGWSGPDAEGFRQEWSGSHLVKLRETAAALGEVAGKVRSNADAQEQTSSDYSGGGGFGPGGTEVAGASDSGFNWGGLVLGGTLGIKALTTTLGVIKAVKTGTALNSFLQARRLGDLAAMADTTRDVYRGASGLFGRTLASVGGVGDDLANAAKFGTTAGRVLGGFGGVLGIVGGFNQMFNTQYDGVRGGIDRVMGGVSVVGGAGGLAIALGGAALLGPVGVGIAVGAGVVAGAWALGNLVYDNWDSISGAASTAAGWVGDRAGDVAEGIGNMADAAGDAVSDVGDAVGDGLSAAGDFVGGLFS
jgi:hypothetical protein